MFDCTLLVELLIKSPEVVLTSTIIFITIFLGQWCTTCIHSILFTMY